MDKLWTNVGLLTTKPGWEINQVSTFCCSSAGKASPPAPPPPASSPTWEPSRLLGCSHVSFSHRLAASLYLLIPHHEYYQRGLSLWSRREPGSVLVGPIKTHVYFKRSERVATGWDECGSDQNVKVMLTLKQLSDQKC